VTAVDQLRDAVLESVSLVKIDYPTLDLDTAYVCVCALCIYGVCVGICVGICMGVYVFIGMDVCVMGICVRMRETNVCTVHLQNYVSFSDTLSLLQVCEGEDTKGREVGHIRCAE